MSANEDQDGPAYIFKEWHERARNREVEELLELYAPDAVLESPLIPVILDTDDGVCRGRDEIKQFLQEGTNRRPNDLVRWYRTGTYITEGNTLIWGSLQTECW